MGVVRVQPPDHLKSIIDRLVVAGRIASGATSLEEAVQALRRGA